MVSRYVHTHNYMCVFACNATAPVRLSPVRALPRVIGSAWAPSVVLLGVRAPCVVNVRRASGVGDTCGRHVTVPGARLENMATFFLLID